MLVTPEIYEYAFKIYGQKGPVVVRKGIKQSDGETIVELYLTKLDFVVVPNTLFKFNGPKSILVSRADSLA